MGEYSIIKGGLAIALPFQKFSGSWVFPEKNESCTPDALQSNALIFNYLQYLKGKEVESKLICDIDFDRFEKDLKARMYFNSSIPKGYGVGSSGALVAAVFSRYARNKAVVNDLNMLRAQLALMESLFHGNSSGLDPLSSILRKPFLVDHDKSISFPSISPNRFSEKMDIFLLDTGVVGETLPLVQWFNQQVESGKLDAALLRDLNDQVVRSFLSGDMRTFEDFLMQLSYFQFENMQPMIPATVRSIWKEGLETGAYTLKLCGSGGGGYMLGFTDNMKHIANISRLDVIALDI